MTQFESVKALQPRADIYRFPAALKGAFVVCALLIASQYLAGFIFLWWTRLDPVHARPLTIARYLYYFGDRTDVRLRAGVASVVGIGVVLLAVVPLAVPRRRSLHGDAKFASHTEIAAAGLFSKRGIILGTPGKRSLFGRRILRFPGQQGVALSAEPRAGKGVSVVIPNLLEWQGSVVCTDIKKENFTVTAGYRRSLGQDIHLIDPLSPEGRTQRWNPLDYVSSDPGLRISDLQLIGNMFFPDPVSTDPFWMSSARSLFLGIGLYLFSTPTMPRTIGEILRQGMANDEEGFSQHWKRVIQGRMSGKYPLPEQCVRALYDVIDLAPQTMSSIRKTFTSRLELWMNPLLDAATSASDFDLRDLRKRPVSIYIGVMPKDLDRLAPLVSLFFQQAIALQTEELPEHNAELKHQVLMLLDEFPALGPIPIIAKASGFLPGYNVRTLLIMQAPSQLRDVYGEDRSKTLLKTMGARVYFAPKDMEDAAAIANELGHTTVKAKSISKPVWDLSRLGHRQRSATISEQKRPLMLPQEVRSMGADREIVLMGHVPAIFAKRIRYYEHPRFRRRLLPPPVVARMRGLEPPRGPAEMASPTRKSSTADAPGGTAKSVDPFVAAPAEQEPTPKLATREATAADIERIDSLTLDDFAIDFSKVQIPDKPDGESLTKEELQTAVDSFLAALREQ